MGKGLFKQVKSSWRTPEQRKILSNAAMFLNEDVCQKFVESYLEARKIPNDNKPLRQATKAKLWEDLKSAVQQSAGQGFSFVGVESAGNTNLGVIEHGAGVSATAGVNPTFALGFNTEISLKADANASKQTVIVGYVAPRRIHFPKPFEAPKPEAPKQATPPSEDDDDEAPEHDAEDYADASALKEGRYDIVNVRNPLVMHAFKGWQFSGAFKAGIDFNVGVSAKWGVSGKGDKTPAPEAVKTILDDSVKLGTDGEAEEDPGTKYEIFTACAEAKAGFEVGAGIAAKHYYGTDQPPKPNRFSELKGYQQALGYTLLDDPGKASGNLSQTFQQWLPSCISGLKKEAPHIAGDRFLYMASFDAEGNAGTYGKAGAKASVPFAAAETEATLAVKFSDTHAWMKRSFSRFQTMATAIGDDKVKRRVQTTYDTFYGYSSVSFTGVAIEGKLSAKLFEKELEYKAGHFDAVKKKLAEIEEHSSATFLNRMTYRTAVAVWERPALADRDAKDPKGNTIVVVNASNVRGNAGDTGTVKALRGSGVAYGTQATQQNLRKMYERCWVTQADPASKLPTLVRWATADDVANVQKQWAASKDPKKGPAPKLHTPDKDKYLRALALSLHVSLGDLMTFFEDPSVRGGIWESFYPGHMGLFIEATFAVDDVDLPCVVGEVAVDKGKAKSIQLTDKAFGTLFNKQLENTLTPDDTDNSPVQAIRLRYRKADRERELKSFGFGFSVQGWEAGFKGTAFHNHEHMATLDIATVVITEDYTDSNDSNFRQSGVPATPLFPIA